jgi:hypothetical protein
MSSQAQNQGINEAEDAVCSGSRTYASAIVVSWEGSSSEPILNVTTTVSGVLCGTVVLKAVGPASQPFKCAVGDNTVSGTYTGDFYADGKSGTLKGDLTWNVNGQKSGMTGRIGTWNCNTSQSAGSSSGS